MTAPLQLPTPPHRLKLRRRRRFTAKLATDLLILAACAAAGALGGWFLLDFNP
ncbi:hypothetical protein [Ferrovibrio sp.]|uniref:hypothetical protein n=1 Tax=Ferrovibrio sp. TaxID=1917215 RepID=UPI0035B092F0